MTNPFLYFDGEKGRDNCLYFPGDGIGVGAGPTDNNTSKNLLPLDVACCLTDDVFDVTGADATEIAFTEVIPGDPGTLGPADDAIFAGVIGMEWTAGGSSEAIEIGRTKYVFTEGAHGQNLAAGAWIYLEASAAVDVTITMVLDSDVPATVNEDSNTVTVQPSTWTYVGVASSINGTDESNGRRLWTRLEANGTQTAGDKLYVGAVSIGENADTDWFFPTTPPDVIDLTVDFRPFSSGTILRTRPAGSDSTFLLEIDSTGEIQATASLVSTSGAVVTRSLTGPLVEFDEWQTIRWVYDPSTGSSSFYKLVRGDFFLLTQETVATTTSRFATSYGFETTTPKSHMLLSRISMDNGWTVFGVSENSIEWTGYALGSEISPYTDGSGSGSNEAFYASMSGWLINTNTTDKAGLVIGTRPELRPTDDFTVVQNFIANSNRAVSKSTYDDFGASSGIRLSEASGVFTATAGPDSVNATQNITDGTRRSVLFERERGQEIRLFVDDFDVADAVSADTNTDISVHSNNLKLGFSTASVDTYMPMLLGVTIYFDRLLEDNEKRDLISWLEAGHGYDLEPDWLRSEAVLYINPTDPVQRAEYAAAANVINLGVVAPQKIYVRYDLTSDDGVATPSLDYNEVRFDNLTLGPSHYETGALPVVKRGISDPMNARFGGSDSGNIVIPLSKLGSQSQEEQTITSVEGLSEFGDRVFASLDESGSSLVGEINEWGELVLKEESVLVVGGESGWINGNWTMSFWGQEILDGSEKNILVQGTIDDVAAWDLSVTAAGNLELVIGNTTIFSYSANFISRYSMIAIKKSFNSYSLFVNGSKVGSYSNTVTATLSDNLVYMSDVKGLYGPLHIWKRAIADSEVLSIYNDSPEAINVISGGTMGISNEVLSNTYVWERI